MRSLMFLLSFMAVVQGAWAAVEVRVCDPNDLHPLGIDEVMLGTQVCLVVSSDANDLWSGGLFVHDQDRGTGQLSSRSVFDPNAPVCLASAGQRAFVMPWNDSQMSGMDLYTDEFGRTSGDWFAVLYTPLEEGECAIYYYDHADSFTVPDPNLQVDLLNSATRDLDSSDVVDLGDWAVFASQWMNQNCVSPGWCNGADLDHDGVVGLVDLLMFSDFWLWGTPNWQGPIREPQPVENPNVFYSILDPNGLSELSIPVGQSIRLYLDKATFSENVYVFDLEVTLSDPNLGWIDNTEYDPNNPAASGTAELLATPRNTFFDYWGPGYSQPEGIQFTAASLGSPIQDGSIASFVYTPTETGTVTLNPADYLGSVPVGLCAIVLHQYDPNEQMMMSSFFGTEETLLMTMSSEESLLTSTSAETDTLTSEEVEEMAQFLEDLWVEEPQIQESFDEQEWSEFVDAVRTSADEPLQ